MGFENKWLIMVIYTFNWITHPLGKNITEIAGKFGNR